MLRAVRCAATRLALSAGVLFLVGCADQREPLSPVTVNPQVAQEAGALTAARVHRYSELSGEELFRRASLFDTTFYVGFKKPGRSVGFHRGRWQLDRAEAVATVHSLRRAGDVQVLFVDSILPMARVRLKTAQAVQWLRDRPEIEYVEPTMIPAEGAFMSDFCGGFGQPIGPLSPNVYWGEVIQPNYFGSKIPDAWFSTNGAGVTIGVTDTRVHSDNVEFANFGSLFGASNRSITFIGTVGGGSSDCAHGTKVASVVGAPMNGRGIAGVAWAANMVAVHGTNSVWTVTGVDMWQAVRAAGAAGAEVVSMAWGSPFSNTATSHEIQYWFYNQDVLFVGAAGTSPAWLPKNYVVWPANLGEVFAVTSVSWPQGSYVSDAHYGPEVDAVAYGHVTTTDRTGYGFGSIGGSSGATAVATGIAALVRARYPSWSNAQVMDRLRNSAGDVCGIPSPNGKVLNALAAVGSWCDYTSDFWPNIYFDDETSAAQTIQVSPRGVPYSNSASYQWSDGPTTRQRNWTVGPGQRSTIDTVYAPLVTIVDLHTGQVRNDVRAFIRHTGPHGPPMCGGNVC